MITNLNKKYKRFPINFLKNLNNLKNNLIKKRLTKKTIAVKMISTTILLKNNNLIKQ